MATRKEHLVVNHAMVRSLKYKLKELWYNSSMNNINTDNNVYIIHAADKDCTADEYQLDIYAVANSYELAEKIAMKDEADGQIFPGWSITRMYLCTTEADI